MPRGRPSAKALAPLRDASDRLQLLSLAGLTLKRKAELVAKSVADLESMLCNPEIDPFARIPAAKTILRDVAGIQPPKTGALVNGSQAPVVINIGTEPPKPRAKGQAPEAEGDGPQVPIVIDVPHNAA